MAHSEGEGEGGAGVGVDAAAENDSSGGTNIDDSTNHALSPLSASWTRQSLSPKTKAKVERVLTACRGRDLDALKELAASEGGLVEDEVRRTACKRVQTLRRSPVSAILAC